MTVPDVTVPDVTVPDVTVPDVTVPEVTVRDETGSDDPTGGASPTADPPVPAGDGPGGGELPAIAKSVAYLVGVLDLPIEEQAERYRAVHVGLQDALSDTEPRESG